MCKGHIVNHGYIWTREKFSSPLLQMTHLQAFCVVLKDNSKQMDPSYKVQVSQTFQRTQEIKDNGKEKFFKCLKDVFSST